MESIVRRVPESLFACWVRGMFSGNGLRAGSRYEAIGELPIRNQRGCDNGTTTDVRVRSALEFNQKSRRADYRRVAATVITRGQAPIPLSKAGGGRAQRKYEDKLILRSIRPSFIRRAKVRAAAPSGLRRVAGVLVVPECSFPVMFAWFVWFGRMSNPHHRECLNYHHIYQAPTIPVDQGSSIIMACIGLSHFLFLILTSSVGDAGATMDSTDLGILYRVHLTTDEPINRSLVAST